MGERAGAPSGFSPASIVISKPPVAVQLPQPDVSDNRDAPQCFLPLVPLYETKQHGEESEYPDEGEDDRHCEQRSLFSLAGRSRDHRKVAAPKVTKPPLVFPNRNHQSHDAAKDQGKAEVARRVGK